MGEAFGSSLGRVADVPDAALAGLRELLVAPEHLKSSSRAVFRSNRDLGATFDTLARNVSPAVRVAALEKFKKNSKSHSFFILN